MPHKRYSNCCLMIESYSLNFIWALKSEDSLIVIVLDASPRAYLK